MNPQVVGFRRPTDSPEDTNMRNWIEPEAMEMRFGFEITMYVHNR